MKIQNIQEELLIREKNILFDKKVRRKKKIILDYFIFSKPFYERESISLKHKIYTILYNIEVTGYTTKGETDWHIRTSEINPLAVDVIETEFKKDYREFINHK